MPTCGRMACWRLTWKPLRWRRCGDERGVPWSVVRAISDRAGDGTVDAETVGLTHPDGRPNFSAVTRYLVRHPGALPRLLHLANGANLAAGRAADAAIKFLTDSR